MRKRKCLIKVSELVCVTFIGYIFAQPDVSNIWLIVPIAIFAGMMSWEYVLGSTERQSRVRDQLRFLMGFIPFEGDQNVRCTYHVPIRHFPKSGVRELRQAFNYIPTETGAGKKFPIEKGIIGEAYCGKRALVANFKDDEDFRQQMASKYKYSEEELGLRRADRRSYLCYSLVDEADRVIGLIYFDSDKPDTFRSVTNQPQIPDENDHLIKLILHGCDIIKDTLL